MPRTHALTPALSQRQREIAASPAAQAFCSVRYVTSGVQTRSTVRLGAATAGAANGANSPALLAGTLVMATIVVAMNRLLWHRLYRLAEEHYRPR